jgi:hypothetical protein
MHFPGGPRATLLAPPKCGKYEIEAELSSWASNPPVTQTSSFEVTEGPDGGPCPSGRLEPKLSAGSVKAVAGASAPFAFRLSREDASGIFTGVKAITPEGLSAKLAGVPYCPDSVLNAISAEQGTGLGELQNPACPASSRVGSVLVGAGAGANPLYPQGAEGSTGRLYLAGPNKGAPLSLLAVTPAIAGPLDLGTIVIRNAIYLNPATAQVSVISDPIPTIIHGIRPDIRDIRLLLDRPGFVVNPTDCEPLAVQAEVSGLNRVSGAGETATRADRFQVGGCGRLAFRPAIDLQLRGGTHRADYQGLRATVTYPDGPGYANIARAAVTLPHAAFLAQNHIRTVCTRVQFAAKQCPAGSIYGRASATSPLLDYPLQGNVYLRSSDNPLPDLVVALRGPDRQPIEVDLAGRTDSVKGALRNTFDIVPDAPVSKFTLQLFGGKRGLIELSTDDYCAKAHRATVNLGAQNGMRRVIHPAVRNPNCAKRRAKAHRNHRRRGAARAPRPF